MKRYVSVMLRGEMTVFDFVEKQFGTKTADYLKRIRIGGDNNKKGSEYEVFYAVAKICEIAANQTLLDDFILSRQETAFVDDFCIRQLSERRKTNYQAKNSSGAAADWDVDMENRFCWQHEIDKKVHQYPLSSQVLLVSCPQKQAANDEKIPPEIKSFCFSEYFPYHPSVTQLLMSYSSLRSNLEKLCDSNDLSIIDAAFRLVLSSWFADDRPTTVSDIIGSAKALAKPNIFATFLPEGPVIPGWLLDKCNKLSGFDVRVEFSRFVVRYNGFEVSLGRGLGDPESSVLDELTGPGEFIAFLMSKAQAELKTETDDSGV